VVPYANSRFSQSQHWTLHPGGRLVLIDWMVAGRLDRGEGFAFSSFESETRVEDGTGRPLVSDATELDAEEKQELSPIIMGKARSRSQRGMGGYSSWLTVHVLGPGWETLHAPLEARLKVANADGRPHGMDGERLAGLGVREGRGFSLRALGTDRAAL